MKVKLKKDLLWYREGQEIDNEFLPEISDSDMKKWVESGAAEEVLKSDTPKKVDLKFDFDKDGDVDKDDASLAAKLLGRQRKKKKKNKKKKR